MQLLNRAAILACILPVALSSEAQISYGGVAFGLMPGGPRLEDAPIVQLPTVDAAALLAEDEARMASGIPAPFRFGYTHDVAIGSDQGSWTEFENGDRAWRVTLECRDAHSIGVIFDRYVIPYGGIVFLYNEAGEQRGAFVAAPNGKTSFGVEQLAGERITIEYYEPAEVRGQGELQIGKVTHAYRDVQAAMRDFGDSGPCQVNAICPSGDDWRDQIRSVAIINTVGSFCTGTLINNCLNDGKPYFLTANHCLNDMVTNWTFTFKWDSPTCDSTTFIPQTHTVSGSTLLVNSMPTDLAFLELDEVPLDEYAVYYSGWDNTDQPAQSVTGIHHPMGDIKKISRSFAPVTAQSSLVGGNTYDAWRVGMFDEGLTQSGSSGSGLWNENGLLVGQLIGGFGTCGDTNTSAYGRFDLSFPLLQEWLGDCGPQMPGVDFEDVVIPIYLDGAVTSITNVPTLLCGDSIIQPHVTLKNNGIDIVTSILVTYGVQGGVPNTILWTGSLQPGQTVNHLLPPISVPPGDHTLMIATSQPNGGDDQIPDNDAWSIPITVNSPDEQIVLRITQDDFGSDITWDLVSQNDVLLYSGGPYPNGNNGQMIEVPFCLSNGCYTFTINDEFGDGICCTSGYGNYVIQTLNGHIFAVNNGQYGDGNVDVFCLEAVSVPENADRNFSLFPNPTNGLLTIQAEEDVTAVRVLDRLGRELRSISIRSGRMFDLDLGDLAAGVYLIEIRTANDRILERVIKQN